MYFIIRASFIGSKIPTPVQRAIVHKEVDSNSKAHSHDLSPSKIPRPVKAFFQIEKLGLNSLKIGAWRLSADLK
ncbi:hypothetical protein P5673_018683, partial [Acropora cervicornis]